MASAPVTSLPAIDRGTSFRVYGWVQCKPLFVLSHAERGLPAGRQQPQRPSAADPRARVLTSDELLAVFQQKAEDAVDRATLQYLELRVALVLHTPYVPPVKCFATTRM